MGSLAPRVLARRLFTAQGWPYLLVPFIPIALALDLAGARPVPVFFTSALGVIPTAALMGRATEELAARSGPGIGGLLNVTFGNAPELIIALFALDKGLQEVVKASIIGSILGNILLVWAGRCSSAAGGATAQRSTAGRQRPVGDAAARGRGFIMPAIFELVEGRGLPQRRRRARRTTSNVEHLSFAVAIVLILTYVAGRGLLAEDPPRRSSTPSTARTTRPPPLRPAGARPRGVPANPARPRRPTQRTYPQEHGSRGPSAGRRALAVAGVAVGVMSEILVGSISEASEGSACREFFVG